MGWSFGSFDVAGVSLGLIYSTFFFKKCACQKISCKPNHVENQDLKMHEPLLVKSCLDYNLIPKTKPL